MFITLTNAAPAHKNKELGLNANCIVTMHTDKVERPTDDENVTVIEDVTFLFCPPHGTWEVQEPIEEVIDKIRIAKK
jgi:hypothetical protein